MPPENEVTTDQAAEALQQLLDGRGSEERTVEESVEVQETTEGEAEHTETAPAEVAPQTPEDGGEQEDIESLRARLKSLEDGKKAEEERFNSRLEAAQSRYTANEQILRDRYLRKATATDKALRALRASRSEAGVSEAEVDQIIREIEGTMNPDSASYAQREAQPSGAANEDQALVLNAFLNEKRMTAEEAEEFGKWIRNDAVSVMSPAEQAVAGQSLDGFMRLAHLRWQDGLAAKAAKAKTADAVGAVRAVQRTQREAARAASGTVSGAPRKQPPQQKDEVDVTKLTKDDISTLLRQSVEQYR